MKRKFLPGINLLKSFFLSAGKAITLCALILFSGLSVIAGARKPVHKYLIANHRHKKSLVSNPTLSYSSPVTFTKGVSITPLAPTSSGVAAPGYNAPVIIGQTGIHYPAGVAVDASGNVYVSSHESGFNTSITEIPAAGGAITQIGFGFSQPGALAVDPAGDVFAVDDQSIKEILAGNTNTITIGTTGNFSSPHAIALDGSGNLYVADGSFDVTGIKEFQNSGGTYNSTYNLIGSGLDMAYGVAVDASGNVYVADNGDNAIKEIAAGNGPVTTLASFSYPTSIAIDNSRNLYVVGSGATYGSIARLPFGSYNSPTTYGAGFYGPGAITADGSGNVYVLDHDEVKEIPAGNGNPVTLAPGFNSPEEIAVDAAGNVFVGDQGNGAVREIPASGGTYPLTLAPGFSFTLPYGVAVDAADNVYVGDAGTAAIYKIAPGASTPVTVGSALSNVVSIAVDARGDVYGCNNGPDLYEVVPGSNATVVVNSSFNSLGSVAVDAAGNIYAYDRGNYNVYKILPGGTGTPVVIASGFTYGRYLTVDAESNVYISVSGNGGPSGIDEISAANGTVTMVAATVSTPYGIAIDGTGNLYATDVSSNSVNDVIDKITPAGGYYLNDALPAGLTFNNTTGIISGLPTAISPATNYTVTAYNSSGSGSAIVNIKVAGIATLSKLTVSSGTLTPGFNTGTVAYTDSVAVSTASIAVRAITTDPLATETINGTAVPEGTVSSYMPLNVGPNTISVIVTSQDGSAHETYTIVVNRFTSSVATLAKLTVSSGILTPASASGITSYTDNVSNTVASIAVRAITTEPTATETIGGTAVPEGTVSPYMPLNVGANTIPVVVTAPDGVTKETYTITVTRLPANDASLAKLTVSSGTLTPAFATGTTSYTDNVASTVSTIAIRATTTDPLATETINGTAAPEGTVSPYMTLTVGDNSIPVVVTAENGTTMETYTITVTVAAPPVANSVYEPVSVETTAETPQLADDGILVHQGVSPNGDGIDDFFQIDNITNYPDNRLMITNRNGLLVYETKGYDNASRVFDGHSNKNGAMQLPGTYFFSLAYAVNGTTKYKTGFIVLKY